MEELLPSKTQLSNWSYKTKINKSLKNSLSKIDEKELFNDLISYREHCSSLDINFSFRFKSLSSMKKKYNKNIIKGNSIKSTFNDIIGIRILVNSYDINIPDYFRIVNMSNGKTHDDGYRGIHLYFQLDNYHYPIEVQLNTEKDRLFADWTHKYLYKHKGNEISRHLRVLYDINKIKTETDFMEEIRKYELYNS